MCKCGHYKSQHPNKVCDYAGYACDCKGFKKLKKGESIDHYQIKSEIGQTIISPKDLIPSHPLEDWFRTMEQISVKKPVLVGISMSTFPIVKGKP